MKQFSFEVKSENWRKLENSKVHVCLSSLPQCQNLYNSGHPKMNYRFLSTGWAINGQSVGRKSFFSCHFLLTRIYRICWEKNTFSKNMKKHVPVGPFNPLGRSTGNKTLFKGGLSSLPGGSGVGAPDGAPW